MTLKRVAVLLLVLIVVLVIAAACGIGWLMMGNLKPIAEDYASELIGRPVTLDSLTVKWGDPLSTDLLGDGSVHARLRYYGESGALGTTQAVGINLSFPQ